MKLHSALFCGSFDPPTLGHFDLIQRGSKLFETLYVGLAVNTEKLSKQRLSFSQRFELLNALTKELKNVHILQIEGLAIDTAKQLRTPVLLRSLRSSDDYTKESQLAITNYQLEGIETLFLLANPLYTYISSSLVYEMAKAGRSLKGFVPEQIADTVFAYFNKN